MPGPREKVPHDRQWNQVARRPCASPSESKGVASTKPEEPDAYNRSQTATAWCALGLAQVFGDGDELHVAGALVDLADFGVAIVLFGGVFAGEADAAEELEGE